MLQGFLRALAIAFRPHLEFLQDTMTLADGRARILVRAEGIGLLLGGDFTSFVNGLYVASLLVPTGCQVRFVFLTPLGPFVKRISVPAMLRVGDASISAGKPRWLERTRVTELRMRRSAAALTPESSARIVVKRVGVPAIDRRAVLAGGPRR